MGAYWNRSNLKWQIDSWQIIYVSALSTSSFEIKSGWNLQDFYCCPWGQRRLFNDKVIIISSYIIKRSAQASQISKIFHVFGSTDVLYLAVSLDTLYNIERPLLTTTFLDNGQLINDWRTVCTKPILVTVFVLLIYFNCLTYLYVTISIFRDKNVAPPP